MSVVCNVLVDNRLAVYRRVKNDCLRLVKRLMFNVLRNTPCGTKCLKRVQDGPGRSGQVNGQVNGQVRGRYGRIMKTVWIGQ